MSNNVTDLIRSIGLPEPQYGESTDSAMAKVSDALAKLIVIAEISQEIVKAFSGSVEMFGGITGRPMSSLGRGDPFDGLRHALAQIHLTKDGR